jgi:hypothetical protein
MRELAAVAVSLSTLALASAQAQVLRCDISAKYRCELSAGCTTVTPTVWNIIDVANRTVSRCDAKGCDTYTAQFSVSGDFINIALPERGMLAKASTDWRSFSEVATLTNVVLVSFGGCIQR